MENGVTAFAPPPAPTYRFVIASNAEKLKITLEDLTSKKQWSTGFLDDKEYLTSTNKIPNASLTDYVKMFKDTLEYRMDNSNDEEDIFVIKDESSTKDNNSSQGDKYSSQDTIQPLDPRRIRRKLTPLEDDVFQLELFVKIRIFQSAWTAKYLFKMEPVTLEQIDILEAKLRDVEDELESTKKTLEEEKQQRAKVEEKLNEFGTKLSEMKEELANAKKPKPFVYAKGASKNVPQLNDKGQLVWTSVKGNAFILLSDGLGVRVHVPGWYSMNSTVYLAPQTVGTTVKILKNGEYLHSQKAPCVDKQNTSVSFPFMTFLKEGDELTFVASNAPLRVGADLDAYKIGD